MEKRKLGNSDMEITTVGLGAWAIGGGGWAYGWGSQDDNDSIAAIREALDSGINWIDTAAVYGLGRSEQVVARALEGCTDRPYVFTKCGLVWDDKRSVSGNITGQSIRREVEDSLRRLQVDVIDLYQVHWPKGDAETEDGWTMMAQLKAEGKVRWIGVSNFNVAQMRLAQRIAPITSLQPPYSILRPDIEQEILPYCGESSIGVIVYSPMQSGLLSGTMTRERIAQLPDDDWRKRNSQFQEPLLSRNLQLTELLRNIGARYGRSAGEVAIAWTLRRPEVTGAIVGARKGGQIKGLIGAADLRLSDAEAAEIARFLEAGNETKA
jgi:aryl-alcohol dehydrogenase-like predicted oxidoreductase